jgi:hypothetical protein
MPKNYDLCKWVTCLSVITVMVLSILILVKVDKKDNENYDIPLRSAFKKDDCVEQCMQDKGASVADNAARADCNDAVISGSYQC